MVVPVAGLWGLGGHGEEGKIERRWRGFRLMSYPRRRLTMAAGIEAGRGAGGSVPSWEQKGTRRAGLSSRWGRRSAGVTAFLVSISRAGGGAGAEARGVLRPASRDCGE